MNEWFCEWGLDYWSLGGGVRVLGFLCEELLQVSLVMGGRWMWQGQWFGATRGCDKRDMCASVGGGGVVM